MAIAEQNQQIVTERNAKKEPITGEDVLQLFADVKTLVVANGKKIIHLDPALMDRQELISAVVGRSGNLRAPALRIGTTFYIGFNEELYTTIAGV